MKQEHTVSQSFLYVKKLLPILKVYEMKKLCQKTCKSVRKYDKVITTKKFMNLKQILRKFMVYTLFCAKSKRVSQTTAIDTSRKGITTLNENKKHK